MVALPIAVKVGGSLFGMPALATQLLAWLELQQNRPAVLIAGGGVVVDQVRALYADQQLDDRQAHWLAIDAMSYQASILEQLLLCRNPAWSATEKDVHIARRRLQLGESFIFDPADSLHRDAGRSLPVGWHVTGDSIAAWAARVLGVTELYLLKSVAVDSLEIEASTAVQNGWIDSFFPQAAAGLNCAIVAFRRQPQRAAVVVP